MARTTIEIDRDLLMEAIRMTGARTESEVVAVALRRSVEQRRLHRTIRGLRGKLRWEGDVDAWRRSRAVRD